MSQISDKVRAAQQIAGTSRHYRGPALGTPPAWNCPQCDATWTTEPADGCPDCDAKARAALVARKAKVPPMPQPAAPSTHPVSPLLRRPGVDAALVDQICERVERVVERTVEAVAQKYLLPAESAPAATTPFSSSLPAGPLFYAVYNGLQLLHQLVQDQGDGADPLMLPLEVIAGIVKELEAAPALQEYLTGAGLPDTDTPSATVPEGDPA